MEHKHKIFIGTFLLLIGLSNLFINNISYTGEAFSNNIKLSNCPNSSGKGSIIINSNPPNAKIFIDNINKNMKTNAAINDLSLGMHKIKITKLGYNNYIQNICITNNKKNKLNVILTYSVYRRQNSSSQGSISNNPLINIPNLYVSNNGNDQNIGTQYSPIKTIQHAIDISTDRTIINIASGRYNEQIIINKSITLSGSGYNTIIAKKQIGETPVITIKNAQQVVIKDLSISGIDTENDYAGSSSRGLYVENTNLNIENIKLYAFRNVYINLYKINSFTIKNIKLFSSEVPNSLINSDLGINIADASGVIDGLENLDNNIDHVIDRTGNLVTLDSTAQISLTDTKPLTIKNSIIRGRGNPYDTSFHWGDGIRFYGNGNNLIILNNSFIGASSVAMPQISDLQQRPRFLLPNAISIVNVNAEITGNTITGFPTAIFIQGLINSVKAQRNTIRNNAIGVRTLQSTRILNYNLDFGGGNLQSTGGNVIKENTLYNLYYPGLTNQIFYAKNNNWNTQDVNQINQKIYDINDNSTFGGVQYQPII